MAAILLRIQNMSFTTAINGASTWVTTNNVLTLWGDVPANAQPAAFLVTHRESDEYRNLGLVRRRLELGVWCYSRSDASAGQTDLDIMLAACEAQFGLAAADHNSRNSLTLGGLVYFCRLEGKVMKDPGDIDKQAMMIVPLVVEIP